MDSFTKVSFCRPREKIDILWYVATLANRIRIKEMQKKHKSVNKVFAQAKELTTAKLKQENSF